MHKQPFSSAINVEPDPKLLIVAPTSRELGIGRKIAIKGVRREKIGIGQVATQNLEQLLDEFSPQLVISIGFAGATVGKLTNGDIVVCTSFMCNGSGHQVIDDGILSPLLTLTRQISNAFFGPLLTVKRPLLTPETKKAAGERSGAIAVDMEGYGIAKLTYIRGVPLIAIRVILDELDHQLPSLVEKIISDKNGREWRHAIKFIYTIPGGVFKLVKLVLLARNAKKSLAKAFSDMRDELEKHLAKDEK